MNLKQRISIFPKTIRHILMKLISILEVIVWTIRSRPIPYPHNVKVKIINNYAKKYKTRTLIETGTYLGQTIDNLESSFHSIYSIELDKKLYINAKKMFSKNRNIHIIHGDSSKILPKIVSKIKTPTLFWLDAHYSYGITAKGKVNTPILSELIIISKRKQRDIILIDDAREFTGKNDYPTIKIIRNLIKKHFLGFKMIVKEDIIRIYPYES